MPAPVEVMLARLRQQLDMLQLDMDAYRNTGDPEHLVHVSRGIERANELVEQVRKWLP